MGTTFFFEVPVATARIISSEDFDIRQKQFQKVVPGNRSNAKYCVAPSELVVEAGIDQGFGAKEAEINIRSKVLEKLAFQTVLIVDDAATNRKMLRLLLGRRRYETEEAEDGLQGVQMVKQRIDRGIVPYDAIIMDFIMPNMDGPTATARIRSLGYTGVIVGVTGNAMQNDIQTFLGKGADKVLIKPLDIDEFIAAVIGKRNVIIV